MCFNPRTHEGCDNKQHKNYFIALVSIHAPTRGATAFSVLRGTPARSFNPRTHEGCDLQCCKAIRLHRSFNPRTHEGCDKYLRKSSEYKTGFNPRTHEGCDFRRTRQSDGNVLFQSTHPRGVRL